MSKVVSTPKPLKREKSKQYKQGGLDALERYLDFQQRSKENIRFWQEWWLSVLSLDKEVRL